MIVDKEKGNSSDVMKFILEVIVDVNLKTQLKRLEAHGMENYTLVMDRGFFSKVILRASSRRFAFIYASYNDT